MSWYANCVKVEQGFKSGNLLDRFRQNFRWMLNICVSSLIQTTGFRLAEYEDPLSCGLGSRMYLSFGLHRQHESSLNKHREYVWKGTVFPNAMFTYLYSLFAATCYCLKSHPVCASCSLFPVYFIQTLLFLFCLRSVYCIVLNLSYSCRTIFLSFAKDLPGCSVQLYVTELCFRLDRFYVFNIQIF